MTAPPSVANDATIDNQDLLLRRVQHGEDGLSFYLESVLVAAGLDATAVVSAPMNAIAALPAQAIRSVGLGVVRDPFPDDVPDPAHPRHAAHALAVGWAGGRKARHRFSQQLARAAKLVVDPGA